MEEFKLKDKIKSEIDFYDKEIFRKVAHLPKISIEDDIIHPSNSDLCITLETRNFKIGGFKLTSFDKECDSS